MVTPSETTFTVDQPPAEDTTFTADQLPAEEKLASPVEKPQPVVPSQGVKAGRGGSEEFSVLQDSVRSGESSVLQDSVRTLSRPQKACHPNSSSIRIFRLISHCYPSRP